MDPKLRQTVLDRYSVPGFNGESEMSYTYLAFSPSAFAVKSYRHFLQLSDPRAFYRRLLDGDARFPGSEWW